MSWMILFLAGLTEVAWAACLKLIDESAGVWLICLTVAIMVASMVLLGIAMKSIPLGTAYAVWTGIGVIGTVLCGIFFFGESLNMVKSVSLILLLVGIIGLKLG